MGPGKEYSYRIAFQRIFLMLVPGKSWLSPCASDLLRTSDVVAMSICERVCPRSLHRSSVIFLGLSLLTGCLQLDRRDVLPARVLGFVSLPVVIPVSSRPLMEDEGESTSRFRSLTVTAWHVSSLRLVQDDGGSILLHSDRRSGALLQGLDSSLVDPSVRPFLFPSCDASVLP